MHRGEDLVVLAVLHGTPPILENSELRTEQRLSSGRPETDDDRGSTAWISASSQGLQADTSLADCFLCSLRFPRGSHLKCLTALVR